MAAYKNFSIFIILLLIQSALANTLDGSSTSKESSEEEIKTSSQKLFIYTFEHFVPLGRQFAQNAVNVSRHVLKDASVVVNVKPAVVDFKNNVTAFVEKYDTAQGHIYTQDILDIYANFTYYYELSGDRITPDTTFLLGILNKYNCKVVCDKFTTDFNTFKENFFKTLQEFRATVEKPLLDWCEKYDTLTGFKEKFEAFVEFLKLA